MPKENVEYRGKVNIIVKRGNASIRKSTHNAGLSDMAMLFAKAVTGNLNYDTDIPRVLDIGYIVPATESAVSSGDSGVWTSILTNPVPIGGRQFKFDNELKNWIGILTTTVYANQLNSPLLANVITNVSNGTYQLKVRLCSANIADKKYFAEINVDENFLIQLRDSTSAIITWYTELLYDTTTNSVTDGNVVEK